MKVKFRQGVIRPYYSELTPGDPSIPTYLNKVGNDVAIRASYEDPIIVNFCSRNKNYLYQEFGDKTAWKNIQGLGPHWLFWEIDASGKIQYGSTKLEPLVGNTFPDSPLTDQHFFSVTTRALYVWTSGRKWEEKIRVFATKYENQEFPEITPQFAENRSQVGLNYEASAGYLVFGENDTIIKEGSEFVTTDDKLLAQGGFFNRNKISTERIDALASQNIAEYECVTWSGPQRVITRASSLDVNNPAIGVMLNGSSRYQVRQFINEGYIHDPVRFNWNEPPNTYLFLGVNGQLVTKPPMRASIQRMGYIVDRRTIYVDVGRQVLIDPVVVQNPTCVSIRCPVEYCTTIECPVEYCTTIECPVEYCTTIECPIEYCTTIECPVEYCTTIECPSEEEPEPPEPVASLTAFGWGDNTNQVNVQGTSTGVTEVPTPFSTDATGWSKFAVQRNRGYGIRDGELWKIGDNAQPERFEPTYADWEDVQAIIFSNGNESSAALRNGTLYVWGTWAGVFGLGNNDSYSEPTPVPFHTNITQFSLGAEHVLVLTENNEIFSSGSNWHGALGNGTPDDNFTLTQIGSDSDWKQVEAGSYSSLGLKQNGLLYCWGLSYELPVGTSSFNDILAPTLSPYVRNWDKVYHAKLAGNYGAGIAENEIYVWGWTDRVLGINSNLDDLMIPTLLVTLPNKNWKNVHVGGRSIQAIDSTGELYSWGNIHESGIEEDTSEPIQGTGNNRNVLRATRPNGGTNSFTNWVQTSSERTNVGGVGAGLVEVGDPVAININNCEVNLSKTSVETDITDYLDITIIVKDDNASPISGIKLNDISVTYSSLNVKQLFIRPEMQDGTFTCRIQNFTEELVEIYVNIGGSVYTPEPSVEFVNTSLTYVFMAGQVLPNADYQPQLTILPNVHDIDFIGGEAQFENTTIMSINNKPHFYGSESWGIMANTGNGVFSNYETFETPVPMYNYFKDLEPVQKLDIEASRAAMLVQGRQEVGGKLFMWGQGRYRTFGFEDNDLNPPFGAIDRYYAVTPIRVAPDFDDIIDFAIGQDTTAVIRSNGDLYTWGRNLYGEMGTGIVSQTSDPITFVSSGWSKIEANQEAGNPVMVGINNGELYAWGRLSTITTGGISDQSSPYNLSSFNDWEDFWLGSVSLIARRSNGEYYVIGWNWVGELGMADGNAYSELTRNPDLDQFVQIALKGFTGHGINSNGELYAWGDNDDGNYGTGNYIMSVSPIKVSNDTDWIKVFNTYSTVFAVKGSNTIDFS